MPLTSRLPCRCSTINSAAVEQLLRRSLDAGGLGPASRAGPGPRPSASPVPVLDRGVSLGSLAQANALVDELVRAQDTPSAEAKVLAAGLAQDRPHAQQQQEQGKEQGLLKSADDQWLSGATRCWPECRWALATPGPAHLPLQQQGTCTERRCVPLASEVEGLPLQQQWRKAATGWADSCWPEYSCVPLHLGWAVFSLWQQCICPIVHAAQH